MQLQTAIARALPRLQFFNGVAKVDYLWSTWLLWFWMVVVTFTSKLKISQYQSLLMTIFLNCETHNSDTFTRISMISQTRGLLCCYFCLTCCFSCLFSPSTALPALRLLNLHRSKLLYIFSSKKQAQSEHTMPSRTVTARAKREHSLPVIEMTLSIKNFGRSFPYGESRISWMCAVHLSHWQIHFTHLVANIWNW